MPDFPASPIPPAEFMEGFLPAAFAEAEDFRAALGDLETRLGVVLEGPSGGEWVLVVSGGQVSVAAEPRDGAAFTLVQSVDDWRGALWEGRGGAIGRQAAALFRPGASLPQAGPGSPPTPAALSRMRTLDGVIRIVVAGGAGGDWRVDFKLGPGAIPPEPTATLTITAADAKALDEAAEPERASLMLRLFMAGRIRVEGDMGLIMQMQAIQMQA